MKEIKVIIVGHSYLAEENRKNLDSLAKFVKLFVVSPRSSDGMIFNYALDTNIIKKNGWEICLYEKWIPPKFPSAVYLLRSFTLGLSRIKPDIVHIESDPFTPLFLQIFILTKIWAPKAKIVCTVKQNTYTHRGILVDTVKDILASIFSKVVSHFIVVNSGVATIYRDRFGASLSKMTYCTQLGVDTDLFAPISDASVVEFPTQFSFEHGEYLVGYCGRLVEYKGVIELIHAVEMLRTESKIDVRLALLGDGPLRDHLLNLSRKYRWLYILRPIPHSDVACFLNHLDIFVMPPRILQNHIEHDAHALLEAMSCGIPCIGTACGAIMDVLPGAGIIVEPEDSESIKNACIKLIQDVAYRNDIVKTARQRVLQQYSLQAVASVYVQIYHRARQ